MRKLDKHGMIMKEEDKLYSKKTTMSVNKMLENLRELDSTGRVRRIMEKGPKEKELVIK